jgi:hypothetical protein
MGLTGILSHIPMPQTDVTKLPDLDLSQFYTIRQFRGWRACVVDQKVYCIGNTEPLPIPAKFKKSKIPYQLDGVVTIDDDKDSLDFIPDDLYVPGYEKLPYSTRLENLAKQLGIQVDFMEVPNLEMLRKVTKDVMKDLNMLIMIRRKDSPYHPNTKESVFDPDTFILYNMI